MALLAACGGDSPSEPASGFTGTFDLGSIDGQPLPYLEFLAPMTNDTLYTIGGSIIVRSNGRATVVRRTEWHTTSNGVAPPSSDSLTVTYDVQGTQVLLHYATGGASGGAYTDTATLAGDQLQVGTFINRFSMGRFTREQVYVRR